ncbi:hypothetical protein SNEBB_000900 [Seison nebaliae]|nr:hypothetical protein SNEBB_000900 [Seison nebaliae]
MIRDNLLVNEEYSTKTVISDRTNGRRQTGSLTSDSGVIDIHRPYYNQAAFNEAHACNSDHYQARPTNQFLLVEGYSANKNQERLHQFHYYLKNYVRPSKGCCTNFILRYLPILGVISSYKKHYLMGDIMGGLTNAIIQIPQGMAYAILATTPPVTGLYTSVFPVLIYTIFGTSRHLSQGSFAIVSTFSGEAVQRLMIEQHLEDTPATRIKICCGITFLTGVIQLIMGIFRLGFLSVYLSDPLVSGFLAGAGIFVTVSQFDNLLGLTNVPRMSGKFRIGKKFYYICTHLYQANTSTIICSVISLFFLFVVKEIINREFSDRLPIPIPIEIILVVISAFTMYFIDGQDTYGIETLSKIPKGIPDPIIPDFEYTSFYFNDAIIVGIISYAISYSVCVAFAKKHNYPVNGNQELVATGASNIFGSFFSCVPMGGSISRTIIMDNCGIHTIMANVVSAVCLTFVILFVGHLFKYLPFSCLAAIIVISLKSLFLKHRQFVHYFRIGYVESSVWFSSWLATLVLEPYMGIFVGMGVSFVAVVFKSQRTKISIIGQIGQSGIYKSIYRYNTAKEIPNIKIIRFEDSLYFTNADRFRLAIYRVMELDPNEILEKAPKNPVVKEENDKEEVYPFTSGRFKQMSEKDQCILNPQAHVIHNSDIYHLILDFSSINYIDTMGIKVVKQIVEEYSKIGIFTWIAGVQDTVYDKLAKCGVTDMEHGGTKLIFLGVNDAVSFALKNVRTLKLPKEEDSQKVNIESISILSK